MVICHKVFNTYSLCDCFTQNLGSLWKIICLWEMGVDIPQAAVVATIKEHTKWHRQQQKRGTPEYLKYRFITATVTFMINTSLTGTSSKSEQTNAISKRKNTWSPCKQLASVPPCTLVTLLYQSVKARMMTMWKITVDSITRCGKPLLFMYDCETTGGSFYQDHIVEIGSMVIAPDGVSISNEEFSSLCHTSRHITRKGYFHLFYQITFILFHNSIRKMWNNCS